MTRSVRLLLVAAALAAAAPLALRARASSPASAQAVAGDSKVVIPVEGLGCASCTIAIRRALKSMDGVKKIEPGPRENEALITYDAAKVEPGQFVEAINKLGFKAGTPVKG